MHKNCFIDIFKPGSGSPKLGTEVGDSLFMLFNLLCSELAFCAAAPYKVQIICHRSHKSSRLNAALAGLVDGRAVMGTFVCGRMNLS